MPIGGNELVRVRLEGIQPILRVENRQATLRFYLDIWASKTPAGVAKSSPASRPMALGSICVRAVRGRAGRGSGLAWMMSAGSMRN
jgi:hypothetical protein